jgi:MFS family permease
LFPSFLLLGLFSLAPPAILVLILVLHAGVGLCWALINVAGSTLVSGLAPEDGRAEAMGAYNAVQGFGSILGPLLGGFVAEFYGYAPAIGATVAFILAGVAILAVTRSLGN